VTRVTVRALGALLLSRADGEAIYCSNACKLLVIE